MASLIFVVVVAVTVRFSASHIISDRFGNRIQDPAMYNWPEACAGKYYCWEKNGAYDMLQSRFDAVLNKQRLEYRVGEELGDRQSTTEDIGLCKPYLTGLQKIYMIKDADDTVWYVPQNANFTIRIQTEECTNLGRITPANRTRMNPDVLNEKEVHCVEQKIGFKFPVLKQYNNKDTIILRSPHNGLPLSCSTKILK